MPEGDVESGEDRAEKSLQRSRIKGYEPRANFFRIRLTKNFGCAVTLHSLRTVEVDRTGPTFLSMGEMEARVPPFPELLDCDHDWLLAPGSGRDSQTVQIRGPILEVGAHPLFVGRKRKERPSVAPYLCQRIVV
jgi:hypothetical protein